MVPNEDMIISWTCDNEPADIRSSRHHVTESGKLRIRSAKVGDSCNYRCEAADGFGTLSVIIKVIIVDNKQLMEQMTRGESNKTLGAKVKPSSQSPTATHLGPKYDSTTMTGGQNTQSSENSSNSSSEELEIYVEPANVHVGKNRSFDLECRVRHALNLMPPQIIWLKEFIGARPGSFDEANAQGLILLDNVYYHSLNWPRSISYSPRSTVNSALLIKHSSFVHSGRYVCFAGYPPARVTNTKLLTLAANQDAALPATQLVVSNNRQYQLQSVKPDIYKMAQAIVRVDDQVGELDHQLSLESTSNQPPTASYLFRTIASNSWIRNLFIVLVLACIVALIIKYKQIQRTKQQSSKLGDHNIDHNQASGFMPKLVDDIRSSSSSTTCSQRDSSKQICSNSSNNLQPEQQMQQSSKTSIYLDQVVINSPDTTSNQEELVKDLERSLLSSNLTNRSPQQTLLMKIDHQDEISTLDEAETATGRVEADHVYSEITERNTKATKNEESQLDSEEPYYKTPSKK